MLFLSSVSPRCSSLNGVLLVGDICPIQGSSSIGCNGCSCLCIILGINSGFLLRTSAIMLVLGWPKIAAIDTCMSTNYYSPKISVR